MRETEQIHSRTASKKNCILPAPKQRIPAILLLNCDFGRFDSHLSHSNFRQK